MAVRVTTKTQQRSALIDRLAGVVGESYVLWQPYDMHLYCYDGSIDTALPDAVVLPATTEQVAAVHAICTAQGVPCTPRGAGTGLSGGAIPIAGGVVVSCARMNTIGTIDADNLWAVVQPGVINLHLSKAVAADKLYFVPDPSSQSVCTIGGNVGENSGGPHTLRHGVTVNHVLGMELVQANGETLHLGGPALDTPGYDLVGVVVGSEGTLGTVTSVTVRLAPLPETVRTILASFTTARQASAAVSAIIAAGIIPAALEMMDQLAIRAIEAAYHAGYPLDAGAVLLIETESLHEDADHLAERILAICREQGVESIKIARDAQERDLFWKGRKGAFAAMGRLSPDYYTMDGVIPRSKLPEVLAEVGRISAHYGLRIPNVFHAGDGNLHPLILFDAQNPEEVEKVLAAGDDILRVCVEAGGTLSGEHGIGIEKNNLMPLLYTADDLAVMERVKRAFDPSGLCNPGKIMPTPGRCVREQGKPRASAGW